MLKRLLLLACACTLVLVTPADGGRPQSARIDRIAREVFGSHAAMAECIARFESTDGAHLANGTSLGPWQINWPWHKEITGTSPAALHRLEFDWLWNARVAYRISDGGTDWSAWQTEPDCIHWYVLSGPPCLVRPRR